MDVFVYLLIGLGGVWGLLTLVGYAATDKKCVSCKNPGPSEYMLEENGKYWHYGCKEA